MTDDTRDDELAARLEVEPLDEVTRRRLVHRALAESGPAESGPAEAVVPAPRDRSRLTRFVAAAAVLVVVAVGVVSLLTTSDSGNETTVAGRKSDQVSRATPQAGSGSVAAQVAPESNADQGASATAGGTPSADASGQAFGAAGATNLGDLGDLSTAAAQRRLVRRVDAATFSSTAGGGVGGLTGACRLSGVSPVLAHGTATFDGRAAFVVVDQRADKSRRVRLVIDDPCEVRQLR